MPTQHRSTRRATVNALGSAAVALGLAAATAGAAGATSLDGMRWNARPLVLFAPDADDARLKDQLARLKAETADLKDRDIKVLTVLAADDPLRARLKAPKDGFLMVLVGKDGHVAQRWTAPQNAMAVYALIDRMPMRKDEVRRAGQ